MSFNLIDFNQNDLPNWNYLQNIEQSKWNYLILTVLIYEIGGIEFAKGESKIFDTVYKYLFVPMLSSM